MAAQRFGSLSHLSIVEVKMANRFVHVVDDDDAVRHSLAFCLGSAGFAVCLYESAQPFLDALDDLPMGCVLTDIRMPGIDGIELLRRVVHSRKRLPVIVMTGHGDVPSAVEAMKLGAMDFIEKPFEDELLLNAIKSAFDRAGATSDESAETQDFTNRLKSLSVRERQVFNRLVTGAANKIIARDLEISPRTVEIYRANVMSKMQAQNLPELVRAAIRSGIL
jgi:two-component system response regulator FixJ